jgi:hypothetical protein
MIDAVGSALTAVDADLIEQPHDCTEWVIGNGNGIGTRQLGAVIDDVVSTRIDAA